MRNKLRAPAPRPQPAWNADVESWLESMPPSTTKPNKEELRQWDLDNRSAHSKGWFITSVVIRALSVLCAVVALASTSLVLPDWDSQLPVLISCPLIMAWDLIEFITICSRRGRGIPPKIHMWADSCIFIGTAAGTGIVVVRIIGEAVDSSGLWLLKGQIITASFLVVLMILHSILLFLFVCNCLERKERKDTKPRVMYLPTGEPVVVLPQPCTTKPASKQPAVLVSRMRRSTSAPAQDVLEDEIITPPSPVADEPVEHNALPPQPEPEPQVPPAAPKPSPVEVEGRTEPFRQGVPPRKPVPGTFVGTPYATPWLAPEYEITEEERDRATRGESQAQWVSLYAGGLSGPATRVTGANGEKSLANV